MDQAMRTKTKSQNLQVFIRVRPQLRSEFGKDIAIDCDKNVFNPLFFFTFLTLKIGKNCEYKHKVKPYSIYIRWSF